jgi:glycosyltransferase involved in cell wall biosynthesis
LFLYGMHVLLLHQYFNIPQTGGPLRSYYLAKALVARNIHVVVITTHNGVDFRKELIEGIEVHYLPIPYSNSFGFVKRVRSFLKFVLSIVREAEKFKTYDVCYAISTPLTIGLAAVWIKWKYKIPYYFEVGDLWPEAPIQIGVIKNPILKSILYRLEKFIYTKSKAIVALSEPIQAAIEAKVKGKPIHITPNMADIDFYRPSHKNPELETKFHVNGKFVVSYIGTFGLANGLERMLHCAQQAQHQKLNVHFLLCGDGARHDVLQQYIGQLDLKNVTLLPMQNREGVQKVLNITDAAFISYLPLPVLETGSPNKYFDALAAGKLIVVNFKGWIKDEINTNTCGVYIDKPENFPEKILPFIQQRQILEQYQQNSRALAERSYARKLHTDAWVTMIAG